ncbi:MAG: lasso RiPP family leader peptide-containing protein [Candidatus Methylomirabilales bacterium]
MKSKAIRKKKTYRPPRLVAYGDFRTLTLAKGGGANDGGSKPKTKASGPQG